MTKCAKSSVRGEFSWKIISVGFHDYANRLQWIEHKVWCVKYGGLHTISLEIVFNNILNSVTLLPVEVLNRDQRLNDGNVEHSAHWRSEKHSRWHLYLFYLARPMGGRIKGGNIGWVQHFLFHHMAENITEEVDWDCSSATVFMRPLCSKAAPTEFFDVEISARSGIRECA